MKIYLKIVHFLSTFCFTFQSTIHREINTALQTWESACAPPPLYASGAAHFSHPIQFPNSTPQTIPSHPQFSSSNPPNHPSYGSGSSQGGNSTHYSNQGGNSNHPQFGSTQSHPGYGQTQNRRLPLLLRNDEEPAYVTVKAKKWKVLSVFRKVQEFFWIFFLC